MRTLKGYEAIELAERYDILLYKFTTQSEVTAAEAREDVGARGNAAAYVIEAWPDSEEEAEQIVLKSMEQQLRESRTPAATIEQLTINANGERFIHPMATELALERLIEKGTLAVYSESNDETIYILTRTLAFTEDFLSRLRGTVCEECADLDLDGPFHESCLLDLFDFLHTYKLSLEDLREVVDTSLTEQTRKQSARKPSSGMQWLSKTVSETRSRWKTVLQPIIKNRLTGKPAEETDESAETVIPHPETETGSSTMESDARDIAETPSAEFDDSIGSVSAQASERPKITKTDLIHYLQRVEVLDNGELDILRDEREKLLRDLDQKESQIQQLRHQKSQLENQYAELQQDMDVLVRAMRIAKQHDSPAPTEVFTAYESDKDA